MTDQPGRPKPRFPLSMEWLAQREIDRVLGSLVTKLPATRLAISGAARGGDILFLESCRAKSIPYLICLPFSLDRFRQTSVEGSGGDWVDRFDRLCRATPNEDFRIMPELPNESESVYARYNHWMIQLATQQGRNLHLIALWDGRKGDGPGGTADLVAQVRKSRGEVFHIDTRPLLKKLEPGIREQ